MSTRQIAVVFVGLLVVAAVSPAFVGTAVAHHEEDDNPLDDILGGSETESEADEEESIVSTVKGFAPDYIVSMAAVFDGQMHRLYGSTMAKNPLADDPPSNREHAITFTNSVRIHEKTYVGFFNNATTPSANYSAHKITFAHEASDPYTVYVVGEIENGSVTGIETYAQDEFNESERTVNVEWVVDGAAAGDLSDLTADLATRIEDDKPMDRSKQSQLVGKYCDFREAAASDAAIESCDIRSSLWMGHDKLNEEVENDS